MPATRCRAVWRVPISRPWLESLSSGLASWWSSIFAPPIARLARLRLAPLAIGDDAHHFVNNVRSNPNFSSSFNSANLDPFSLWRVRDVRPIDRYGDLLVAEYTPGKRIIGIVT